MKKKLLAILTIGLMVTGVMGFAARAEAIPEEEAEAMREEGTLESDALTGYEYSENTDTWYYSNYPNYKDFKEDGVDRKSVV